MGADTDTLAEQLERTRLDGDVREGERLRNALKARLLDAIVPETRIDRFVVLGQLGAGGMGIVYAAYDPQLDRKVAIKLVRTWGTRKRGEDQQRLAREARALARLSHPNIVAVYEVGIHGDDVFVAMEFVHGKTLRDHVGGDRMHWKDIVRAYLQAGEGLAAAHAAGLVHRDFKPDNALVGDDGRVRVLDFGIARGEGTDDGDRTGGTSPSGAPSTSVATAAMLGTPAYMAPEQRLGLRVMPSSDQFSFCAALHEALVGAPPLADADGLVRTSTLGAPLPARLRRAVARGLSAHADARFPDMRALLVELRATLDGGPLRRVILPLAAVGGIAAGAAMVAMVGRADDPCPDPAPELAGVWGDTQRAQLRASATALGDEAVGSLGVLERELDRRAAAWLDGRSDACEALWVRRTESEASFDRRMGCLARSKRGLGELIQLLGDGDAAMWQHAVDAVVALAPVEACEAADAIAALPGDAAGAAEVERLRASIDRVGTLGRLGRLAEARPLADATVHEAIAVGHRPTEAEALQALAALEEVQQREDEAAPLLEDALWRAEAGHADELAVELLARAIATAVARGRIDEASSLERRLGGAVERLGRATRVELDVEHARYLLAAAQGRYDDAEAHARAVIAAGVRHGGTRSLEVARGLTDLGLVRYERAEYDGAAEDLETALTLRREWLDERHPEVLQARINLASAYERQGHGVEARAMLESVIADAEHAFTGPSPVLSMALDNLANLRAQAGEHRESLALVERSLGVLEASVGPDDPRLLQTLLLLGNAQDALGRTAPARAAYERVVAIAGRIDPEHPLIAYAWNNIANIELASGDPKLAHGFSTRALELWRRSHGAEHPVTAQLAYSLALADFATGAMTDAILHAEQAIPVLAAGGSVDAPSLAGAQFVLARALASDGSAAGRARGIAAAQAALATFVRLGNLESQAEVRAWIAARTFP